eukprot:GHVT01082519.1.p2 GENE.GHVT01082519.1~~GHVT01082519.1.p2  ORF type:complete len:356 (+),score=43.23 GHVT01082519.1:247-1314(+)
MPFGVAASAALPLLSAEFENMSPTERDTELQSALCMRHCVALWRIVLAVYLPALVNPGSVASFEHDAAKAAHNNPGALLDPGEINSVRSVLKSDPALYFNDQLLPKSVKTEMKRLKFGQATYQAYMTLLAGRIQEHLGNQYFGRKLQVQAPYFANMVRQWIAKRSRSRKLAIIGLIGIALSAVALWMVNVNTAASIGGTAAHCLFDALTGNVVCTEAAGTALQAGAAAAATNVAAIGATAALVMPMIIASLAGSAYLVARSEIKLLLRMEYAISGLFQKLKRKIFKDKKWTQKLTDKQSGKTFNPQEMLSTGNIEDKTLQAAMSEVVQEPNAGTGGHQGQKGFSTYRLFLDVHIE